MNEIEAGKSVKETGPSLITTVIVDDDPVFRKLLTRFLASLPQVEVIGAAGNGREALELVASLRPKLVLMDIGMSEINGLEAADMVRELHPSTRVIIISMNDAEDVQAACLARGADGFVSKSRFQLDLPGLIHAAPSAVQTASNPSDRVKLQDIAISRALEQKPISVFITDLTGRIEYVNHAFVKVTGFSKAEALGRNPRILKSGRMPPGLYEQLWKTVKSGLEWRGEFLNKSKDGRLFWESAVISPILDEAGRITHFLSVNEDITQKKHLEEQLRQAQKMEAIGQLAGGVAHDFNNILVAILMHLGMLQNHPHLAGDVKESLKQVEKEAVRAANLTRQLLMFSRQQAARPDSIELNALIQNLLSMLRRLLGENIEVISCFDGGPMWIVADSTMIEQVVMNLCINARDAMPNGGKLIIETTLVEIAAQTAGAGGRERSGHFVCLSISDTGCGMDKDLLGRIFEPFFTTKEPGKGTGLGLATVYGIAQQHGGWVEVDSIVGRGSKFRVFIPGVKTASPPPVSDQDAEIKGGSETLLLVEDEVYVRRLVAQSLRSLGYSVLEAGDTFEALQLWDVGWETIALLFTDTLMPGSMTGLDLAAHLRKEKPSLKVISSSGYSAKSEQTKIPGAAIVYLPKPYSPAALARLVRRCLDSGVPGGERCQQTKWRAPQRSRRRK